MTRALPFLCFRTHRWLLPAALLLALASPIVPAADNDYRIELLVFKSLTGQDDGELFLRSIADTLNAAGGTRDVNWLGPGDYELAGIAGAMRRSDRYAPLLHVAWEEKVAGRSDARPVALPVAGAATHGDYVTGTARVGLGRYLHLDLDLVLHEPSTPVNAGESTAYAAEPEYRLQESRRMRSKEIHYFDHPLFGVLAIITPVE